MSEYQHYEFLAIDKPVTDADQKWLRSLSTRAEITSTGFVNTYNWGDFKGDPFELMERCFDAHVYVSNFGFNRFMVKLPRKAVELPTIQAYVDEYGLGVHATESGVILDFRWEQEDSGWGFDDEATSLMASLTPLRHEIMLGDLRALYLAWLVNVEYGILDESAVEPPVPPGLKELTAAQIALIDFLCLDSDLVAVAAETSGTEVDSEVSAKDIRVYVDGLAPTKRDALLTAFLLGEETQLRLETLRQIAKAKKAHDPSAPAPRTKRRTAAQLEQAWERRRQPA